MPPAPQKTTQGPQLAPRPDDPVLPPVNEQNHSLHSQCIDQPALQGRVPGNREALIDIHL